MKYFPSVDLKRDVDGKVSQGRFGEGRCKIDSQPYLDQLCDFEGVIICL